MKTSRKNAPSGKDSLLSNTDTVCTNRLFRFIAIGHCELSIMCNSFIQSLRVYLFSMLRFEECYIPIIQGYASVLSTHDPKVCSNSRFLSSNPGLKLRYWKFSESLWIYKP